MTIKEQHKLLKKYQLLQGCLPWPFVFLEHQIGRSSVCWI
jgi:hypothetical protein